MHSTVATRLKPVRTAWSLPHLSSNARVSGEARSRPAVMSLLLVRMTAMNVNGTTAPMRTAATSQTMLAPKNHAVAPAANPSKASGACSHVARL